MSEPVQVQRLRHEVLVTQEQDSGFAKDILWACDAVNNLTNEYTKLKENANSQIRTLTAEIGELKSAVIELWLRADTGDLDAEMALFVGGIVGEEMYKDRLPTKSTYKCECGKHWHLSKICPECEHHPETDKNPDNVILEVDNAKL